MTAPREVRFNVFRGVTFEFCDAAGDEVRAGRISSLTINSFALVQVGGDREVQVLTFSYLNVLASLPILLDFDRTLYSTHVGYIAAGALALSGYSAELARLVLLDATLVLFFVLALLFALKWIRTSQAARVYGGVPMAALAIQVRVIGVLAVMLCLLTARLLDTI